ncbi:MAG: phosphohistidine phosphatase [Chlorobium sp.]|nr:MAG: phosphohistidine phosphatase [Chlorobium sp.]
MKTIYVVRHAKAGLGGTHTGDFDRKLNEVGLKAAHFMAELLEQRGVVPELVLSSPAERAINTAEIFCDILRYPKERLEKRMEIYEGGAGRLLTILQQIADTNKTVMLFGHNPTISSFSNLLAVGDIDSLATCGVVRIDVAVDSWREVRPGSGKLIWYEFPKRYQ